jgi:hypothetical protein
MVRRRVDEGAEGPEAGVDAAIDARDLPFRVGGYI